MTGIELRYAPPAGGGAPATSAQVTTITASGAGVYVIPSWAKTLRCQLLGAGGPGGSGRQGAAATVRCGGGPGGNGAYVDVTLVVADLVAALGSSNLPYSVGAAAAGGAAVAVADTNGNAGTATTSALNGTFLGAIVAPCFAFARPGGAGSGGTNATGTTGASPNGTAPGNTPLSASTTGGVASVAVGCSGAGGGITAADVASAGAASSVTNQWGAFGAGGNGGIVGGAGPTSGTAAPILGMPGMGAGGGAASILAAAQAGANALPNTGCGGPGGGASLNGFNSGAGGNSGSGCLVITAYG